MEKAFEIQKNARNNAKTLQTYMTDLQNWETEMKRKEAALSGDLAKDLPPVRSKVKPKREKLVPRRRLQKRISSSDYTAWEKFDVEKACEDIDMAEVGPTSLDSKKSQKDKQEKLREEAQYEKERGNAFVKQEKWDEAISCYNRAIELYKNDAIYYANRGLCYLKKDVLHQAEKDCTEALKLDPTYVKALQRRATARERLGSLRGATNDLNEVIKLEPHNVAAARQLEAIKMRMGTKGAKSKSSPTATPTGSMLFKVPTERSHGTKITELPSAPSKIKELSPMEKWKTGEGEDINVLTPVKKPPHLRSKRALKPITIQEIPLGQSSPVKPPTRMQIVEIEDNFAQGDTNKESNVKDNEKDHISENKVIGDGDTKLVSPESVKLITDEVTMEKHLSSHEKLPPVNSVQFMSEWKYLKGQVSARSSYLSIIEPSKIPAIFENALESDVLSEILQILCIEKEKFSKKTVTAYLKGLCKVKRFSALAMFLTTSDKKLLNELLEHCRTVEKCKEEDAEELMKKFEL